MKLTFAYPFALIASAQLSGAFQQQQNLLFRQELPSRWHNTDNKDDLNLPINEAWGDTSLKVGDM